MPLILWASVMGIDLATREVDVFIGKKSEVGRAQAAEVLCTDTSIMMMYKELRLSSCHQATLVSSFDAGCINLDACVSAAASMISTITVAIQIVCIARDFAAV
ncbi:hypothetical protein TNCV_786731 [Trichonephila clavipes]|nr:hypothetical protein TNCV_786731 [Trichonephila clavipes]